MAFPKGSFFGRQARSRTAQKAILDAAEELFGKRPPLDVVAEQEGQGGGVTVAQAEAEALSKQREQARSAALNHPRVKEVLEVFPEVRGEPEVRTELD